MGEGGQFGFGEYPDDLGDDTAGAEPLRGWISPEDRLWRHPSEMAASAPSASQGRLRRGAAGGRLGGKWSALAAGALGAAAVASAAVVVTGGTSTSVTGRIAATDTSLVTNPAGTTGSSSAVTADPEVAGVVEAMEASLVTILPQGGSGAAAAATGVVLPGGDLVLTAASALGNAPAVVVETAAGRRQTGTVEGVDAGSGVAVVRIPAPIPAATFGDEAVSPHQLVVAACRCRGSGGNLPWAVTMVHQVGTAATLDGGPSLVDAIEAEMPLGPGATGGVILDVQGQVLGVLDGERSAGAETFGYFVPAGLALGVAQELAAKHRVTRGWLGVVCEDDGAAGATVTTVLPGSPAATAGLRPSDVVEAVGAKRVGSLADLEALLYTTPPGTHLELTVSRAGSVRTMPVTLAGTPS